MTKTKRNGNGSKGQLSNIIQAMKNGYEYEQNMACEKRAHKKKKK